METVSEKEIEEARKQIIKEAIENFGANEVKKWEENPFMVRTIQSASIYRAWRDKNRKEGE